MQDETQHVSIPVILAVDDNLEIASALERDLPRRYSADYQVIVQRSPSEALEALQRLQDDHVQVALVIAGSRLRGTSGLQFLSAAHALHLDARRLLLAQFGEGTFDGDITRALALGQIDNFAVKPWASPEEWLYVAMGELLSEWARSHLPTFELVRLVGSRLSVETHRLQDVLDRNPVPYGYYTDDSEQGRLLIQQHSVSESELPAAIFPNGRVLGRPSHAELADALGASTRPSAGIYDVAVIGAGPAGLAASVYGASEGLRTVVLEREAVGGQAGTSSMIRNYLGFPRGISGRALATGAFRQSTMFGADIVLMNDAVGLTRDGPYHLVSCSDGSSIAARTVVIATGVSYRRLGIPTVEALSGLGVFYGAGGAEAQAMRDRRVFIAGAGNSAGQAAIHLAKYASRATLLVRKDSLGASMSDYLVQQIATTENIDVRFNMQVRSARGGTYLDELELQDTDTGRVVDEQADALFILIGAEPHTSWLPEVVERDAQGYVLTGRDLNARIEHPGKFSDTWSLQREPHLLETSVPGVFAAGDVRHLSMKRVASAVGEGSTAIALVHQYLREDFQPERVISVNAAVGGEPLEPAHGGSHA